MGMEFRPYYLAREWEKMGHKVRIVAADFSHLRKNNPKIKRDFEIQQIDGIEYQWIRTRQYDGNGIQRAITMFQFCGKLWLRAKKIAREFNPDVVISSSTYPLDTYPAQKIAKLSNAKYIHEGHDLWPLTLTEIGGMSKWNPFVLILAIAERSAYKKSDRIVSVLPNSIEHMLKHGLKKTERGKFSYIPNGIVKDDWENCESAPKQHEKLFSDLKKDGKFIVCYVGGHALSNALDQLLDVAGEIGKITRDISFVLVGKGVEKQRMEERKETEKLENVHFLPPVNKKQVPSILEMADALYVGAEKSPLYKYGVSMNKVYDYMMSGKPILYGVVASNNEVEEANSGLVFDSYDINQSKEAILKLANMQDDEIKRLGNNGKQWVMKNCEYSKLANIFSNLF